MVEVKTADDSFDRSLFRFRRYLPGVRAVQVVLGLKRAKNSEGVEMTAAHEFLEELAISSPPALTAGAPRTSSE